MFINSANLVQISNLDKNLMVVGRVGTGKTRELKKMALSLPKVLVLRSTEGIRRRRIREANRGSSDFTAFKL